MELKRTVRGLQGIEAPRYALSKKELRWARGNCEAEALRFLEDLGIAAVHIEGQEFTEIDRVLAEVHTPPIKLRDGGHIANVAVFINRGIKAAGLIREPDEIRREMNLASLDEIGLTAHRCSPDGPITAQKATTPETKSA